ncbi:MAG TPA: cysteine desulfurase family protein [Candidatus Nanoarchaeia archaeon]|nr:cysteine desulfurase family protein [Candidatus Nanoarchaeia archaeon]
MIYLDYAAAAPARKEVRKVVRSMEKYFANPSSGHDAGNRAKWMIEGAREKIKEIMNASSKDKIIFTASGTESLNLAIKGVAQAYRKKGSHIITSTIEHKAVLETCKFLEKEGFKVTYLKVDQYGRVNPKEVEKAITKKTILVSIMYANNEVGTIQPIKEIAAIAKKKKVLFHTDACQAGFLALDVQQLGVDLLTLNSNKIYGPKGAGLLYLRKGVEIQPLIHGGGQEYGLRSGTENVAAIRGFGKALGLAQREKEQENKRLQELRAYFVSEVRKKILNTLLNGHPTERLPNNVHLSFAGVEAETVLYYLSLQGIFASAGSACTANEIEVSHVLKAMNVPEKLARGSIRFSLGKYTGKRDIDKVIAVLVQVVNSLRKAF